ncbi:hypothetical protein Pla163_26810 [Planctomycetes bacterium Pla163]|uniref:DUF3108 domain-containing protein n=1 Tax=Rohdeia mirabilis TaxID=2528008 RepID=A0A518D270_9BACT|nr:hypothetical protein Pla163_26810 [Planctomycetes bacterium Pla163]
MKMFTRRPFAAFATASVAFALSVPTFGGLGLAAPLQEPAEGTPAEESAADEPEPYRPPFEVRLGDDYLPLLVPRGEVLEFVARVDVIGIKADAGRVSLKSEVRPFQAGLFAPKVEGAETAWIEARALGEYGVYSMDSRIESLFQPQAWPSLVHRFTQTGTEQRRRELLVGVREEGSDPVLSYRTDTRTGAPKGTRIWRDPRWYDVPFGTVDTVGASYVVRSMIRDDRRVATLNTLDKERVWETALTLGAESFMETPAGTFRVREVHLATRLLSDRGQEADPEDADEGFSGPFGIRGHIRMFVEASTGIPIAVRGSVPAGPIDVGLQVLLTGYSGTPPEFAPADAAVIEAAAKAEAQEAGGEKDTDEEETVEKDASQGGGSEGEDAFRGESRDRSNDGTPVRDLRSGG